MRVLFVNFMVTALIMLGAASASAVAFVLTTDYGGGVLIVGDQVVVTITLDTNDLAGGTDQTLGFASSVLLDGSIWAVVGGGGTQNPLVYDFEIAPSFGVFGGVPLVSPLAPNNTLDPNEVRMGIWGGATPFSEPTNTLRWGVEQLATVTLEVIGLLPVGETTTPVNSFFASGDSFNLNGANLGGVGFNGVNILVEVIPEPGTALLMGLGLAGLSAAGRRRA